MAYTNIKKSSDYFNTKLWSGNGSSQALTDVGHQTDMVWIKSRTDTRKHNLYDVVRGVQKRIVPNDTVAEDTVPGVTAFGTDGFTVGSETDTNGSSRNFVGWSWNANGTGVANTDGSVTATVSANQTSGFSVIKLTNPASGSYTVGHGLGVAPDMLIFKSLDGGAQSWFVLHKDLTNYTDRYLRLQDTVAEVTYSMQTQVPTNSLLYLNSGGVGNGNSGLICYAFASKQGFSKFGSYTGNANNGDGTFVYTGFKPAFIMVKNTARTQNWSMHDSKRPGYNEVNQRLQANLSDAESSNNKVDLLSNGFKWRTNDGDTNGYAEQHIYMAFAEQPLVGDNPATAR